MANVLVDTSAVLLGQMERTTVFVSFAPQPSTTTGQLWPRGVAVPDVVTIGSPDTGPFDTDYLFTLGE